MKNKTYKLKQDLKSEASARCAMNVACDPKLQKWLTRIRKTHGDTYDVEKMAMRFYREGYVDGYQLSTLNASADELLDSCKMALKSLENCQETYNAPVRRVISHLQKIIKIAEGSEK